MFSVTERCSAVIHFFLKKSQSSLTMTLRTELLLLSIFIFCAPERPLFCEPKCAPLENEEESHKCSTLIEDASVHKFY